MSERMRDAGAVTDRAGVPLRRVRAVEGATRLFSTPSRPALRPGSDTTRTGAAGPTLGRVEPNRSSGREPEGSTSAALAGYVEDAFGECLEFDRSVLNQGRGLPARDRPPAPRLADRRVADLSTVVSVLRACYESSCGD